MLILEIATGVVLGWLAVVSLGAMLGAEPAGRYQMTDGELRRVQAELWEARPRYERVAIRVINGAVMLSFCAMLLLWALNSIGWLR